jgi:hypothetical protein
MVQSFIGIGSVVYIKAKVAWSKTFHGGFHSDISQGTAFPQIHLAHTIWLIKLMKIQDHCQDVFWTKNTATQYTIVAILD